MDPDGAVSGSEAQQTEEEGPIKEIGEPNFHIDLTGGGKPVTKQTKKGLKMGRSGGVHGNITKSTQLMMKRGLLKASLTSKSHMRQGRKGERGAEEEAQAGKGEEIGHMQSETGDPADDGHQVLQENFTVEENLVFETEEDDLEWNLDKEICKIIEIGCALGCDFSGKENFIGEELMRREKEDERRFRESNEWHFSAEDKGGVNISESDRPHMDQVVGPVVEKGIKDCGSLKPIKVDLGLSGDNPCFQKGLKA
ncbi:hypothetical protein LWI29_002463 [Acer saccharum]|uniref:Uncharacterized protein n=1 Tax=Acer saccharum TaxID=4024 RepID=A0AA39VUZ6_ACESA|nr:hypothetical protein LWI29_002463 [Acer saccharum]